MNVKSKISIMSILLISMSCSEPSKNDVLPIEQPVVDLSFLLNKNAIEVSDVTESSISIELTKQDPDYDLSEFELGVDLDRPMTIIPYDLSCSTEVCIAKFNRHPNTPDLFLSVYRAIFTKVGTDNSTKVYWNGDPKRGIFLKDRMYPSYEESSISIVYLDIPSITDEWDLTPPKINSVNAHQNIF